MIKVLQLGLGKQGNLNIQKLEQLSKQGYNIKLVGMADLQPHKLEECKKYEVAREARPYIDSVDAIKNEMPGGVDAVFISTWTHQHEKDLEAIFEFSKTKNNPKVIGCEKPAFLNLDKGQAICDTFKAYNIKIGENLIELYSPTKQTSISKIADEKYDIVFMEAIRGGPVKGKSVKREENILKEGKLGTGGIFRNFDNSFDDKLVHDIGKAVATIQKRYGNVPESNIIDAYFEKLEIITPEGQTRYFTRDGKISSDSAEANACYSNIGFGLGDIGCHMIGSWIDLKEGDMKTINSIFNEEVKKVVSKSAGKDINPTPGKPGWDWETRAEYIEAKNKKGENIKIVSSTFGHYFTTQQVENGDIEVLQQGGGDFHLEYIRDIMDVAIGNKAEPLITGDSILKPTYIMYKIRNKGFENVNAFYMLDLRKEPKELALALGFDK